MYLNKYFQECWVIFPSFQMFYLENADVEHFSGKAKLNVFYRLLFNLHMYSVNYKH